MICKLKRGKNFCIRFFNILNNFRPAQVAKLMLSLAIFISHSLQMYVAIDITWNQYLQNVFEKSKYKTFWEYAVRTTLVLITCTYK